MQNRRVAWHTWEGDWTGHLIEFMALHDDSKVLVAHAIIEMADGRVKVLDLDIIDFRFVKEDMNE